MCAFATVNPVPTDPVRLDLYAQLLDAALACQDEAMRIEQNPIEVPPDLRDDESPPFPADAIRAMEHLGAVVRRIELAAPRHLVHLAGDLSLEATQVLGYAVDRPGRAQRQRLRDLWSGHPDAPQIESETELAEKVSRRFSDAREAFVRAARVDLGATEDELS
jgi:hypothetical protein